VGDLSLPPQSRAKGRSQIYKTVRRQGALRERKEEPALQKRHHAHAQAAAAAKWAQLYPATTSLNSTFCFVYLRRPFSIISKATHWRRKRLRPRRKPDLGMRARPPPPPLWGREAALGCAGNAFCGRGWQVQCIWNAKPSACACRPTALRRWMQYKDQLPRTWVHCGQGHEERPSSAPKCPHRCTSLKGQLQPQVLVCHRHYRRHFQLVADG
jgi:hypothetical protein